MQRTHQPQDDGEREGHVHHHGFGCFKEFTFDAELNLGLLSFVHKANQKPRQRHQNDDKRHAKGHPLTKGNEVLTNQIFKRNGIRRCADWRTNATNVSRNRNTQGERNTPRIFRAKYRNDRRQNRQHHRCGGGIRHEHREYAGDHHQSQHDVFRILAEWLEQHTG